MAKHTPPAAPAEPPTTAAGPAGPVPVPQAPPLPTVGPAFPDRLAAGLTVDSSDDDLILAMRGDADLLQRVQNAATQAHQAARMLPGGPVADIDWRWQVARARTRQACDPIGGFKNLGTNTAADQQARAAMLRIAMEVGDYFRALVAKWPTLQYHERAAIQDLANRAAIGRAAQAMPVGVQMVAPPFNVPLFLADLARRGIHIRTSDGGTILAGPGYALTPQDRETMKLHKAAIVAALADEVAVA